MLRHSDERPAAILETSRHSPSARQPSKHSQRAFVASAALTALALALAAHAGGTPTVTAALVALAFLPYVGLLLFEPGPRADLRTALLLAAASGLVLVIAPSVLSDDVYRYLWDARVLLSGVDPYAYPPDAPALAGLRDDAWARINHRHIPTIYPPAAQGLFALAVALWSSVTALKALALGLHLATVALLPRVVSAHGGDGVAAIRAVYLLALNPLALAESALGGHVDVAVGLCALMLGYALLRRRQRAAAGLIALASGLKLVGIVLAPLLLRGRAAWAGLALLLSLGCVWPLAHAGSADAAASSGVGHYAQRWRGNEGPYGLVEHGCRALVDALAADGADRREGVGSAEIELELLAPVLARLQGTPFDPGGSLRGERKQRRPASVLDRAHLAGLLARSLVAAFVFGLSLWLGLRGRDPLMSLRAVLLAVLLLSPQLHPWYLLWLLPVELALGRRVLLVWSAVALVAYAPLDGWLSARQWQEPAAARPLQFGLVLATLVLERWQRSRGPVVPADSAR